MFKTCKKTLLIYRRESLFRRCYSVSKLGCPTTTTVKLMKRKLDLPLEGFKFGIIVTRLDQSLLQSLKHGSPKFSHTCTLWRLKMSDLDKASHHSQNLRCSSTATFLSGLKATERLLKSAKSLSLETKTHANNSWPLLYSRRSKSLRLGLDLTRHKLGI